MNKIRLGDVVERVKRKVDKDTCGLEYYVGGEHFDNGEVTVTKKGVIKGSTIGPAFHMHFIPGDVLLMSRNPHLRKAGMVDFEGICSDVSYVCRTKNEDILIQSLLPFIFQSDDFWGFAEKNKKGSTNFFLNWSDFENYEFNLPNIEEQQKLSNTLWSIENSLSAYKNLQKETDELVKAQFIEMFGDPITNTKGWDVVTIGDIATDVKYGTSKSASEVGKYPYIRMNNITYDGNLDLSDLKYIDIPDNELDKCVVKDGDILFNRTNSAELVGKTTMFNMHTEMVIAGYIIRVRLNQRMLPIVLSKYLNLDTSKTMLRKMSKGAVNQANINAKELQSIEVYVPDMKIQNQFADFVKQADKSKFALQETINSTNAMLKTILNNTLKEGD